MDFRPFNNGFKKLCAENSGLTSLMHCVISLPDATPCDKWKNSIVERKSKMIFHRYSAKHENMKSLYLKIVCLFDFDSLRPINNLLVIKGRVFLG